MLKQIAHRVLNGILLKPFGLKLAYRVGSNPVDDMIALFRDGPVSVILDGGAYEGSFSREMAKTFPTAIIHAFEPTPLSFSRLKNNTSQIASIKPHRLALGAMSGHASMVENSSPVTNSLRKSSGAGRRYFAKFVAEKGEFDVEVVTIADFAGRFGLSAIDMVKLDLQGNELDALIGMGSLIATVKLVFAEVQFVELYEGAPLFADIELFLRNNGLVFYQLYDMVRSPNDGRLLYADATFVRSEVLERVHLSGKRL